MSTNTTTLPATGTTPTRWFDLARHDEPDPDGDDTGAAADDDAGDDSATADEDEEAQQLLDDAADDDSDDSDDEDEPEGLGDAGKRALARMKADRAAAKKELAAAKKTAAEERRKAAALAKKVEDFEDRDRTELEKAAAKADRSEKLATKAVARAVAAEVKAGAAGKFADLSDATDALMRDPQKYVDADGDIDTDAIESDLADLLERKPHWAAPAAPSVDENDDTDTAAKPKAKPKPKPDPGQGSRKPAPPRSFLDAPKEEVDAELLKLGIRPR